MSPRLILVCGPLGAGKTTHSIALSKESKAIRFSIDPWMHTLFSKDMVSLDLDWITERVNRCGTQIWDVAEQILTNKGQVILDLGFTTKVQREAFSDQAALLGISSELHFLDLPKAVRKARIEKRNTEKDPSVYSFEVSNAVFEFMDPKFEAPDDAEMQSGIYVKS